MRVWGCTSQGKVLHGKMEGDTRPGILELGFDG